MSLVGVELALKEAECNVSSIELGVDVDLEVEDHSEEMYAYNFSPINSNRYVF